MYSMWKNFNRLALLSAAMVAASDVPATDWIGSSSLTGTYGMTSTQSCVRTPFVQPQVKGFDDATKSLLLGAESVSAIGSGIMRFNRNGTVSLTEGRFTEILNDKTNPGDVPVSALTEFGCAGSYVSTPDRKVAVDLECTVKPPAPGVTITIRPLKFEGYVGRNRHDLQLSSIDGAVQTVAVSVNGQVAQQRQRICVQNASLSRL